MNLKILRKFQRRAWHYTTFPEIKLEGKWIEKLGFEIGGEVLVKQHNRKLTITLKKVEKEQSITTCPMKSLSPVL